MHSGLPVNLLVIALFSLICLAVVHCEFAGDKAPVIIHVQGRIQRRYRFIIYTKGSRIPGSQVYRRIREGVCKSISRRLYRPQFLRQALVNCNITTISWDNPWVTVRLSFDRVTLENNGISAGCYSFATLLRANIEKYGVCDCMDVFSGRIYVSSSCDLLAVAGIHISALVPAKIEKKYPAIADEVLSLFPPGFNAQKALRNVFLIGEDILPNEQGTTITMRYYFSEYVFKLNGVNPYCNEFRTTAQYFINQKLKDAVKEKKLVQDVSVGFGSRVYEDVIDMNKILEKGKSPPQRIPLVYIPDRDKCQVRPRSFCPVM